MIVYTTIDSPLGAILLAATDNGLMGTWFEGQRYYPHVADDWQAVNQHPLLDAAREQLADYFAGQRDRFDLPLAPKGTPFQQRVWQVLQTIPYGDTTTYGALAQQLGQPTASRAVGSAVGHNPLSVIVPCHRAVGANGSLTGYAGGLDRKRHLLTLERSP